MTSHHLRVRFERCGKTFNADALLTSESKYEKIVKSVYQQMRNVDSKPLDVDNGHGSATSTEDSFALNAAIFAADVFPIYTNSYENNGPRVCTNGHLDKRYTQWESRVPSLYSVSEKGTLVITSSSGGRLYPDMEDDGSITANKKRVDFFFGGEAHSLNASLEVKMEPNASRNMQPDVSPKVQPDASQGAACLRKKRRTRSAASQGAARRGNKRTSKPAAERNKSKRARLSLGARVSVEWKHKNKKEHEWYNGTVEFIDSNDTVTILYDDGECVQHIDFLKCEFRILPAQS